MAVRSLCIVSRGYAAVLLGSRRASRNLPAGFSFAPPRRPRLPLFRKPRAPGSGTDYPQNTGGKTQTAGATKKNHSPIFERWSGVKGRMAAFGIR
jgi:hypothetical protein